MKKELKEQADSILWGFALRSYPPGEKPRIHIRFGRIGLFFLGLLVIGWLSVAGALYFYFKKGIRFDAAGIGVREHGTNLAWDEVTYGKMIALPFRMDAHRRELGDFYLRRAESSIEEKNFGEALDLLRLGVTLSPTNLRGRRILSEFFDYGFKQPDDAADILVSGVKYGGYKDADYMSHVYRFLLNHEYDERIIELGEDLLKEDVEMDKVSRVTALATATAFYNLYKFDRAQEYIKKYELTAVPEGNILLAQMHWQRGEIEEAITLLDRTSAQFPNAAQIFSRISDFLLDAGDPKRALRTIVLAQVSNPASLELAVKVLLRLHDEERMERLDNSFADVLENFATNRNSCLTIAATMADLGLPEHCEKVKAKADQLNIEDPRLSLAILKAKLLHGDDAEAQTLAEGLLTEADSWKVGYQKTLVLCMKALAHFGQDDNEIGNNLLRDLFKTEIILPPDDEIHAMAQLFQQRGFPVQTRKLLIFGRKKYPFYRPILEDIVRQDLETGNFVSLPKSIRDLLGVKRKNSKLLMECRNKLASDYFLFVPEQRDLLDSLANSLRKIQEQGALPKTSEI